MKKAGLLHCLRQVVEACTALKLNFALVGGMGLAFRATERTTKDIDFAVAVRDDCEAEEVVRALQDCGYVLTTLLEHKKSKRLATARLLFPPPSQRMIVDLLFASCGIEAEIVSEGERMEVLPGLKMKVARTPHLLAMKVLSMDRAGRSRDMDDARALIKNCTRSEVTKALRLLDLITERGYHRGRRLRQRLTQLLKAVK